MPPRAAALFVVGLGVVFARPATGQILAPDRPGPFAIDIRGVTMNVPQHPEFFAPLPANTLIPARGFGIDLGGHVYLFDFGPSRVGVGADFVRIRGTASPPAPATSGSTSPSTPATRTMPDVGVVVTTLAPQLSFNFGSSLGWSYLSLGGGLAQVNTSRSAFRTGVAQDRNSGTVSSANIGGGARWFAKTHVAFSFDVRFYAINPGPPYLEFPGSPRTTMVVIGAGVSVK